MIWFLVVGGILLIMLGVWGGPRRKVRPDKASRIPKEATVQEAWDILTAPVQYDEELIKIPEHKPWFIPGGDRRFRQGLMVGLGLGLLLAALLLPFLPAKGAPPEPPAPESPAGQTNPADETPGQQVVGKEEEPTADPGEMVTPPPVSTPPQPANVTFVVEPGSTSQQIAASLKAANLIADEQEFLQRVVALGVETRLQAGTFVIPTGATVDQVIGELTQ